MKFPHFKHTVLALCATFVLIVAAFGSGVVLETKESHIVYVPQPAAALFPLSPNLFPEDIHGKAAMLYDPADGRILFQKDARESLPLASITKLMTAEVVLTALDPNTPIVITADDLTPDGNWGFKVGDTVVLKDLLRFGLVASSNDAMQAAAESLGGNYIGRMNEVAASLGLTATHFYNPTGLDVDKTTSGAYGSAYDVARLAALFFRQYPFYSQQSQNASVSIEVSGRVLSAKATAVPLLSIPGFVGAKTGYTDLAGGNLVAVFDVEIGHPLIAVVLGSTEEGRFADIKTIIKATQAKNAQTK